MRMYHRRTPGASIQELASNSVAIRRGIDTHGFATVRRDMLITLRDELRALRVLSFSRRLDNFSMWAQYAAGHRGYCLEFCRVGVLEQARPVVYDDAAPLDPNDDNQDNRSSCFTRGPTGGAKRKSESFCRATATYLRFDPLALTRIVLGKDMSEHDCDAIRVIAQTRVPALSVESATLNPETHKLEIC